MAQTIDVNATIERVGVGRLAIFVIALGFCMMISDGFDFTAMSVATPAILRDWHIGPKDMGVVFSVTFFGLLVGSLFYGWMADRFGRKFTIVFGTFNFGIPVLLTIWAANVEQLMVLRFIGGIGMGGIVPIAYTLVSDYAPRRMRSTVTVITNSGYNVGGVLSGLVGRVGDCGLRLALDLRGGRRPVARHGVRADRAPAGIAALPGAARSHLAQAAPPVPAPRARASGSIPTRASSRTIRRSLSAAPARTTSSSSFTGRGQRPPPCCGFCSPPMRWASSSWRAGCRSSWRGRASRPARRP